MVSVECLLKGIEDMEGTVIDKQLPNLKYEWYYTYSEKRMGMDSSLEKDYTITINIEVDTLEGESVDIITEGITLSESIIKGIGQELYSMLNLLTQQEVERDVRKREIYEGYLGQHGKYNYFK